MEFSFWLQSNNGKKFSLDDLKKLKPEDIAKNSTFKKIINFYDLDGSGNIETKNSKGVNEWQSIFTELQSAAGDDKVLSDSELCDYLIKKSPNENIKTEEFKEFLDAAKQESIEDTYTDDKGNTITDKYGYGGILSRTIVSKDESENEVIALVLYENNKPSQQIQKRNNEVVAIINYDYSNDEENPTTTTVFKNDRGVVEEFDIPSKKRILTQYNSNDVEHFDSNDSDRLQQVAIYGEQMYIAEYDGKGNTIIIVQNSETPELIAQKFGVKLADLIRVNKGLTRNTVLQAGQKFIVPGEFNADSKVMYPRKSEAEVKNKAIRHTFNKVYDKIFSSAIDEYTIKPENAGKDVYEYAEKYLIRKGLKKTDPNFNARKNDLANELIALNGKDAKYTAGSKIKYVKKTLNQATVNELRSVGFEPNEANQQFFARFNYLEPKQQQNVIAVLKHCKAKGIIDPQKINAEIVKYYPEIQLFETDMKVLQKPTKGMARGYMARYLLQQIDAIIAMYNQVATSDQSLKTLGTGLLVEIQDLLHVSTKFINDNLGTCIAEGDSRVNLAPMLNKLRQECVNLVVLADMEEKDKDESFDKKKNIPGWEGSAFDKQFKELFNGQTLNYDAVATYLQALQEFQKAPEADRNNKNSQAYKKIEQATKALNQKIPNFESVGKRIEGWSKGTSFVGGLVDLGVMVGMMYMSGGTAAIGRSAMYMGNGARLTVGNAVGRLAISDGSKFIMSEGAGIFTSMVTSSAETAAFFQTTKVLGALEDGQVTRQEVAEIQEGFEGLFKFSMVGSAIAGPIGNKVAELTSKALNSEPMIARIMQTAVEGNGTSLDKVLKALAENSEAISKITEFGTSFSINAGYLMYDENEQIRRYNSTVDDENLKQDETSYLGAMGNLGAMDAVSKLVVAMLGGKNMAFLTPRKVQQIKTSLAGYDVKLTVFKGQKIYEVTDKTGTKTRLANEQELFMFIVDREISVLKDTPSAAETISNPVTTDVTRNFEVTRNGVHTETSEVTNPIEQRLEQAYDRESFVAIRDEISKLPHGEEKTRLMQAYLQKYNAWSADPSRPDIRMQYIPETETPQVSVELTKETFLQHLKDIGLNEDMVNTFAENIESGSIDLSVCKDFIDVAKNDKELLSDLLGSIIFCDVKAEDIPAKIEAYKLAKSQSNLSVMDQAALILLASASKTPKQALAEVVLSNKYEDIKSGTLSRIKAEKIQALKDCEEKNGAEFVLENFELLSRNFRFASEVNANNLKTAKLLDEYRTKMNRPIPQERAFAILANPEHYVARIRRGIDDFENDANLIAKGIENKLFDTTNGFEIRQMKRFVEYMENHPEVAKEWVDNSVNLEHISMDGFDKFINGRESNGEKPLTEEQRKLVYEVIKYRDENGYPNMNWTSSTRTALLELSPKYYELIKNSVIGTNQDFCSTAEFINKCAKNQPEVLENLEKDLSNNPKLLKYFGLEAIAKHKDKVELFIEHEDLLKSFQEHDSDISVIFEQVSFDVLKEGMSILKDVPEEVKTKFKDALAKLYTVEIANKIGMVPFKSDLMLEVYKKAVNYEDDVAETLIKTLWGEMGDGLKHIELSNLDFVANYIKSKDYPDRTYIIKVLNSSEDIGKNTATLTEMLENKDKLLKQVAMRCQNTNPEFVKFVEEYLNSEDAYDLVFMPNLSINTLANNFFEVSKIFQYVNTKPQDYINGHYDEKIINALKDYRKKDSERTLFNSLSEEDRATVERINNTIKQNIDNKFTQILDAISSTDIETVKLLLDKRFSIFQDKMSEINELSGAAKVILADVIRNGKRINKNGQPDKLTGQQKIDMINLIKCATSIIENFDINNYKTPLKKGAFILDSDRLHDDIFKAILSKKGLSQEEINKLKPENLNWNMKYLSLLFNTPGRDEGELADVVKAASMGDFNEFINDVNNKYGQTNLQTRQAFESNGVNYEQWLRPDVADVEFEVAGKQCHIRMWDRNPQEDMFLGSKTSCCTALDRTNGGSMAVYMLNTSYNVVELYDAKGNVVGMSRIFMAKVDGKPTLIMDNIELNHEFIKGMDYNVEIKEIRDNFFKYMNTYAEKITGDPNAQVLFYSGDIHVPNGDLTRVDNTIDFLGGIHREEVYVNAVHCSYHNPTELKDVGNITWLKVPKE